MEIAVIRIFDSYGGRQVEIMDNPDWGMSYRFYLSEDEKALYQYSMDSGEVYVKAE